MSARGASSSAAAAAGRQALIFALILAQVITDGAARTVVAKSGCDYRGALYNHGAVWMQPVLEANIDGACVRNTLVCVDGRVMPVLASRTEFCSIDHKMAACRMTSFATCCPVYNCREKYSQLTRRNIADRKSDTAAKLRQLIISNNSSSSSSSGGSQSQLLLPPIQSESSLRAARRRLLTTLSTSSRQRQSQRQQLQLLLTDINAILYNITAALANAATASSSSSRPVTVTIDHSQSPPTSPPSPATATEQHLHHRHLHHRHRHHHHRRHTDNANQSRFSRSARRLVEQTKNKDELDTSDAERQLEQLLIQLMNSGSGVTADIFSSSSSSGDSDSVGGVSSAAIKTLSPSLPLLLQLLNGADGADGDGVTVTSLGRQSQHHRRQQQQQQLGQQQQRSGTELLEQLVTVLNDSRPDTRQQLINILLQVMADSGRETAAAASSDQPASTDFFNSSSSSSSSSTRCDNEGVIWSELRSSPAASTCVRNVRACIGGRLVSSKQLEGLVHHCEPPPATATAPATNYHPECAVDSFFTCCPIYNCNAKLQRLIDQQLVGGAVDERQLVEFVQRVGLDQLVAPPPAAAAAPQSPPLHRNLSAPLVASLLRDASAALSGAVRRELYHIQTLIGGQPADNTDNIRQTLNQLMLSTTTSSSGSSSSSNNNSSSSSSSSSWHRDEVQTQLRHVLNWAHQELFRRRSVEPHDHVQPQLPSHTAAQPLADVIVTFLMTAESPVGEEAAATGSDDSLLHHQQQQPPPLAVSSKLLDHVIGAVSAGQPFDIEYLLEELVEVVQHQLLLTDNGRGGGSSSSGTTSFWDRLPVPLPQLVTYSPDRDGVSDNSNNNNHYHYDDDKLAASYGIALDGQSLRRTAAAAAATAEAAPASHNSLSTARSVQSGAEPVDTVYSNRHHHHQHQQQQQQQQQQQLPTGSVVTTSAGEAVSGHYSDMSGTNDKTNQPYMNIANFLRQIGTTTTTNNNNNSSWSQLSAGVDTDQLLHYVNRLFGVKFDNLSQLDALVSADTPCREVTALIKILDIIISELTSYPEHSVIDSLIEHFLQTDRAIAAELAGSHNRPVNDSSATSDTTSSNNNNIDKSFGLEYIMKHIADVYTAETSTKPDENSDTKSVPTDQTTIEKAEREKMIFDISNYFTINRPTSIVDTLEKIFQLVVKSTETEKHPAIQKLTYTLGNIKSLINTIKRREQDLKHPSDQGEMKRYEILLRAHIANFLSALLNNIPSDDNARKPEKNINKDIMNEIYAVINAAMKTKSNDLKREDSNERVDQTGDEMKPEEDVKQEQKQHPNMQSSTVQPTTTFTTKNYIDIAIATTGQEEATKTKTPSSNKVGLAQTQQNTTEPQKHWKPLQEPQAIGDKVGNFLLTHMDSGVTSDHTTTTTTNNNNNSPNSPLDSGNLTEIIDLVNEWLDAEKHQHTIESEQQPSDAAAEDAAAAVMKDLMALWQSTRVSHDTDQTTTTTATTTHEQNSKPTVTKDDGTDDKTTPQVGVSNRTLEQEIVSMMQEQLDGLNYDTIDAMTELPDEKMAQIYEQLVRQIETILATGDVKKGLSLNTESVRLVEDSVPGSYDSLATDQTGVLGQVSSSTTQTPHLYAELDWIGPGAPAEHGAAQFAGRPAVAEWAVEYTNNNNNNGGSGDQQLTDSDLVRLLQMIMIDGNQPDSQPARHMTDNNNNNNNGRDKTATIIAHTNRDNTLSPIESVATTDTSEDVNDKNTNINKWIRVFLTKLGIEVNSDQLDMAAVVDQIIDLIASKNRTHSENVKQPEPPAAASISAAEIDRLLAEIFANLTGDITSVSTPQTRPETTSHDKFRLPDGLLEMLEMYMSRDGDTFDNEENGIKDNTNKFMSFQFVNNGSSKIDLPQVEFGDLTVINNNNNNNRENKHKTIFHKLIKFQSQDDAHNANTNGQLSFDIDRYTNYFNRTPEQHATITEQMKIEIVPLSYEQFKVLDSTPDRTLENGQLLNGIEHGKTIRKSEMDQFNGDVSALINNLLYKQMRNPLSHPQQTSQPLSHQTIVMESRQSEQGSDHNNRQGNIFNSIDDKPEQSETIGSTKDNIKNTRLTNNFLERLMTKQSPSAVKTKHDKVVDSRNEKQDVNNDMKLIGDAETDGKYNKIKHDEKHMGQAPIIPKDLIQSLLSWTQSMEQVESSESGKQSGSGGDSVSNTTNIVNAEKDYSGTAVVDTAISGHDWFDYGERNKDRKDKTMQTTSPGVLQEDNREQIIDLQTAGDADVEFETEIGYKQIPNANKRIHQVKQVSKVFKSGGHHDMIDEQLLFNWKDYIDGEFESIYKKSGVQQKENSTALDISGIARIFHNTDYKQPDLGKKEVVMQDERNIFFMSDRSAESDSPFIEDEPLAPEAIHYPKHPSNLVFTDSPKTSEEKVKDDAPLATSIPLEYRRVGLADSSPTNPHHLSPTLQSDQVHVHSSSDGSQFNSRPVQRIWRRERRLRDQHLPPNYNLNRESVTQIDFHNDRQGDASTKSHVIIKTASVAQSDRHGRSRLSDMLENFRTRKSALESSSSQNIESNNSSSSSSSAEEAIVPDNGDITVHQPHAIARESKNEIGQHDSGHGTTARPTEPPTTHGIRQYMFRNAHHRQLVDEPVNRFDLVAGREVGKIHFLGPNNVIFLN